MKSLKAFDTQDVGLRGCVTEEVITRASVGGGDRHVDGFADSFGEATDGLLVKSVAHHGRRAGTGRLASSCGDGEETILFSDVLADGERDGRVGQTVSATGVF